MRARVLSGSSLNLGFTLISWSASPNMLSKHLGRMIMFVVHLA